MATVAVTKIKANGKEFAPGEKVNKNDFSKEEWADLVEAGAVGPEPPAPLVVEEEEETEASAEEPTKEAAKK